MSSQRSTKPSKPPNQTPTSRSSSLSSHLAMVELKQQILTSLNKLADRDTQQIALEDLEKITQSLSNDGIPMLLNCLYDAVNDPKPALKKEGVRLIAAVCAAHTDPAATHLTKIIAHIVKRLNDADSLVREACRDAIGVLAGLYLKGGNGGDGIVSLFVKPLFEVLSDNSKAAQSGAALCLAKMVECASDPRLGTFQKLCNRVCKYLNSSNFMAKASMLQVVSRLSQVGAITPQILEPLLQSVHECLTNPDWATRKAAADSLSVLSLNSNVTPEGIASTLNALEACRYDKVKPVRESMTEALQLWKKIAGKGEGSSDEHKASSHDGDASKSAEQSDRQDRESEKSVKVSSCGSSPTDPNSKGKGNNMMDKAVGILKKRAPSLTDKEPNPEFFQKLETITSDDLPVEVIIPRSCANSNSQNEEESESNADPNQSTRPNCQAGNGPLNEKHGGMERGNGSNYNQRDSSSIYLEHSRTQSQSEGFMNNKENWLAIQRQLLLLERQQSHLMNMLQDFMGGSHDSMVTLENRVRGLERVIEVMTRDLSISSGRSGGFEGSSNRSFTRYNGFLDYSNGKIGGRGFTTFDGSSSGMKSWDFHSYSRNGHVGPRRFASNGLFDIRAGKSGEGPSARSVWQASKDEATLEAIRVAGEDNGVVRSARVADMPEMVAEADDDDRDVKGRDPIWTSWSNAMDALHVGDVDSAFAEVLSNRDDFLLVKLMDRSGPVINQLSNEVACEVVNAVSQFLLEQNLFEMCLYWVQQLADIIMENGPDFVSIPMEVKREILLNLHEVSSSMELPEDWEGSAPHQLLLQLASAWEIDHRQILA